MINYQLFPRSVAIRSEIKKVITCFENVVTLIDSTVFDTLVSNDVLKNVEPELTKKRLGHQ